MCVCVLLCVCVCLCYCVCRCLVLLLLVLVDIVVVVAGDGGGGVSFSIVILYQSISTRIETQPIPQHKVNTLQINNIAVDVVVYYSFGSYILYICVCVFV